MADTIVDSTATTEVSAKVGFCQPFFFSSFEVRRSFIDVTREVFVAAHSTTKM